MKGNHQHRNLLLASLLSLGMASAPTQAEDIEVFFTKSSNTVAPNVLFVLDSSGSMNEESNGSTRMQVLQNSLHQILKPEQPYKALNVGIMDFSGNRSGGIDFPITDINSDANLVDSAIPENTDVGTVLDYISKSYKASGKTPMGDALYFSSSYYSGSRIFNTGWRGRPNTWNTPNNSYTGGSIYADNPAAYENGGWVTTSEERSYTDSHDCSESLPSTDAASCSNARFTSYSCTDRPERARYCYVEERICDSSGMECSWIRINTVDPVMGADPIDPDGAGNKFRVRCWGPYAANRHCHGTEAHTGIKTTSGFDTTPVYKSPITQRCQSNYVVMLTDGEPTRNDSIHYIASRADPVIGSNNFRDCADLSHFGKDIHEYGRCIPELVEYMANYDQSPDLDGKQSVYTYTIGFKLAGNTGAQDFLKLLAEKSKGTDGEGEYFDANSPDELAAVFRKIINEVTGEKISFSAPTVGIDQNNRLATSEYLYRPEFTPSDKPRWSGDIVKTKLGRDNDGNPTFTDEAPTLASTITSETRKIYTNIASDLALTAPGNQFKADNTALVSLLEGLNPNGTTADKLIPWALGVDIQDENSDGSTTDERRHMGDALHTTPALVNYVSGTTVRQVLYVPTNEGLLHAFDVSETTPSEIFAFLPAALLGNLDTLYRNNNNDNKVYGLDGNLAVWKTSNRVVLYFGMRRGGRNYYALDVTDPDSPELLWNIEGGAGDFAELGQTWSTPQLTKVMSGGSETMALVFGGGYDPDQDDTSITSRTADDMGRSIFIVNALTGEKIWSAGPTQNDDYTLALANGIPSDVRIIDLDGNGRADRLYVGDTGGRVWRVDMDQSDISNSSGYMLADLNGGSSAASNRRFYYAPSVAFDRRGRLMVAIGSGYRAHPAEAVTMDRFYAFEDVNAKLGAPKDTPKALTENNLGDISDDLTGTSAFKDGVLGWYLTMNSSEKVLAEPVIFNNNVIFTSYQPTFKGDSTTCNQTGNTPRAYMLTLEDGRPARKLNSGSTQKPFTLKDRYKTLATVQFIPGSPYITFNKPKDSGKKRRVPLIAGDAQTADLYVGKDLVDSDSFLTDRISWRNR